MIENKKEIVIISAVRPDSNRTFELATTLRDSNVSFKQVDGVYKGDSEVSFVCVVENNVHYFVELCREFDQDCILFADESRNAILVDQHCAQTPIGKLVNVSKSVAQSNDNYTYCPTTKLYFICK